MIKVHVKAATRQEVTAEITSTPATVFNDLGISLAGASTNLNGTFLDARTINATFAELGVEDGATVYLNSVVKADGASN